MKVINLDNICKREIDGIDDLQGIYIKDLQIELGNKKTEYEEFKYQLNAEIRINLEDKKDEITNII